MEEHCECGGQFWSPGKSKGVSEGCPNCNRPYRDQPSPTISDMDMAMKEMPEAAGDGGLNSDMSGNPLKSGILADNGWQNRNKRDEFSGSVKRETFDMEPILPWWITSAEEHSIEGDAEIGSVMPPTPSDSPTVEAKLVDGTPGWHGATTGVANMSLGDFQPPVVIDGEPYSQEMGRQLMGEYMLPDHPPKTFMISHPDPEYLEVLKSVIETGRPEGLPELQQKIINQKSEEHGKEHAIHESVLDLPGKERNGLFHDDNTNLSRALYATQAHTYGVPYLSGDQESLKDGISASHAGYKAGDTQIPIATSHPELGEVLQRVSDFDSLDPLFDWLGQHPEITEEQKEALRWLAEQNIMDPHEAKTSAPMVLNPPLNNWDDMMAYNPFKGSGPMSPQAQQWLKNYMDTNHPVEGPATRPDMQGRPAPQTAPQAPVEPAAPKPNGGNFLDDIVDAGKGAIDDVAKKVAPVAEDVIPKAIGVGKKLAPKALGLATLPLGFLEENPTGILGLDNPTGKGLDASGADTISPQEKKEIDNLRPNPSPTPKPAPSPKPSPAPAPAPSPAPKTAPSPQPTPAPFPKIGPGAAAAAGAAAAGAGGRRQKPTPKPPRTKTRTKPPKGRPKMPSLPIDNVEYKMNNLPPVQFLTHNKDSGIISDMIPNGEEKPAQTSEDGKPDSKLDMLKKLVNGTDYQMQGLAPTQYMTHVKNAERDDADEHPSSHSEIPANDITDPDKIDPHQKKEDDNSDWQKDYSVNDIGGSKQDPGAVVVTVSHDQEPFSVEEIADIFGVDKDSEPVKLISDFWDHFMDHVDQPEHERDNDDPILSLLKELLGNERDNGSK